MNEPKKAPPITRKKALERLTVMHKELSNDPDICAWEIGRQDIAAMGYAIQYLQEDDFSLANAALMAAGVILGGVAVISAICGVGPLCWGDAELGRALTPYFLGGALLAVLSFGVVWNRLKRG